MRYFHNIRMFGIAVGVTTILSSCIAGVTSPSVDCDVRTLVIQISGVNSMSRAVDDKASTTSGTVKLTGGHIFIIDISDKVVYSTPLVVKEATSTDGQFLSERRIHESSRVYILGNIPSSYSTDALGALADLNAIKALTADISTQADYTKAVLANTNFVPAGITVSGSTATATISIKPVISRLELVSLQGESSVRDYTVTGVWIDNYYSGFTFGGSYSGTLHDQNQSTDLTGVTGDTGIWPAVATGASGLMTATPGSGKVWAYNVAAGSLPRIIIRLTDLRYNRVDDPVIDLGTAIRYLTVMDYTSFSTGVFEPGKVYRIAALGFDWKKITETPNPVGVALSAEIQVSEWEVVDTGGNILLE